MTKSRFIYGLALVSLLTACVGVPVSTMWKMRNFDPLSANPNHIRFAVITDQRVQLHNGSTSMKLSFVAQDPQYSMEHEAVATLKRGANVPALANELAPHQQLTLFHLSEQDAAALQIAQSKLKHIKAQDIKGDGSLSISVNSGCFAGQRPDSLPITVFAQFDQEQGYIKMIDNFDVLAELDTNAVQSWKACDVAAAQ